MKKSPQNNLPVAGNDVGKFLKKVRDVKSMTTYGKKPGRLSFIIDATASRQPAWDRACRIQEKMFKVVEEVGRLDIQLIYFRGISDFYASEWYSDSHSLLREMKGVDCMTGHTMIEMSLKEVLQQTIQQKVSAAVFIGDACEETTRGIYAIAGQLGVRKTPVFMFQENFDPAVEEVYRSVASLSKGAYCRFDSNSADLLTELLSAVAVYAAGGQDALKLFVKKSVPQIREMTRQLVR